jgi:hypothetical protein
MRLLAVLEFSHVILFHFHRIGIVSYHPSQLAIISSALFSNNLLHSFSEGIISSGRACMLHSPIGVKPVYRHRPFLPLPIANVAIASKVVLNVLPTQ